MTAVLPWVTTGVVVLSRVQCADPACRLPLPEVDAAADESCHATCQITTSSTTSTRRKR